MQLQLRKFLCRRSPLWLLCGTLSLGGCAILGNDAPTQCRVLDPELSIGQYQGGCDNGLAEGYGEVSGTSTYRGDFHAGKKHGKGIKVMPNGDRYEGDFDADYRHGTGTYVWGPKTQWAGQRYTGQYQRDKRHGWGVFQWETGDRYEGTWENDVRQYASARELRQYQHENAQKRVVGAEVCNSLPFGADSFPAMRGTLETRQLELYIRLTSVEGGQAEYYGQEYKAGDVLLDDPVHWPLCGKK